MTKIDVGMFLKGVTDECGLREMYRVVQVNQESNNAVLIPIPCGPRKTRRAKRVSYYARGFVHQQITTLCDWMERKLLVQASVKLPPLWLLSDAEIECRYPPRTGAKKSAPLVRRDNKWDLIRPLIEENEASRSPDVTWLYSRVAIHAKKLRVSRGQLFDALHRYYAFGCLKNALLPDTFRSGAPKKPRFGKNGKKLGRKNAAAKVGNLALAGLILSEKDIENIQDGWVMFVRPGVTVADAYLAMCGAFYSRGNVIKHGEMLTDLLPAEQRPTLSEFRHHGAKSADGAAAARRLLGEGAWARDYRPLLGSARNGVFAVGQVGALDASPIDVNLVACFDRSLPIGVARGLFVHDTWLGMYVGFHIAIGGIGTDSAKLAILCGATDKTELLKRYQLDLPPEDFPTFFFNKYLTDNGELRSINGFESIVDSLCSHVELVKSGGADRNSVAESGHHSRHRGLDHRLKGTTRGRQRKRGEQSPIKNALLTQFGYVRLLLYWMHWVNTKQDVPHLLTVEMRRQNVPPRRIEIYRWAQKNGYVAGRSIENNYLRAHLLSTFKASVQRNGLVLHRPGTPAGTVELLKSARFNSPYLGESGIIHRGVNGSQKHIQVRADPNDLSAIYLVDDNGIHLIPNTTDDAILLSEGCMNDLGAINDFDRRYRVETQSKRDQDAMDQRSYRENEQAEAKRQKHAAKSRNQKSAVTRQDVRTNQWAENNANLDAAAARGASSRSVSDGADVSPQKNVESHAVETTLAEQQQSQINKLLIKRGLV